MPDLKTEMLKIAHAWDTHEQQIRNPQPQQEKAMTFTKTGNATKDIFEYIKLHGHSYTPMQVTETMVQQGYVASSVSSLIAQMKTRGLIALDDNGRLYPLMAPAHVWTAENVLMNIGVAEAAKLYAELGKLFGGK